MVELVPILKISLLFSKINTENCEPFSVMSVFEWKNIILRLAQPLFFSNCLLMTCIELKWSIPILLGHWLEMITNGVDEY